MEKSISRWGRLDANNTSSFTDEARGEMAFAAECAERLLTWMNITFEEGKQFVRDQGPYFSGGVEQVEIPALAPGDKDLIFPNMHIT